MNPWELHPTLIHFPIAFLLSGAGLDLLARWRRSEFLSRAACGLLMAGVITGLLAAGAGLLAFYALPAHSEASHQIMSWHITLAASALLFFVAITAARWPRRDTPPGAPLAVAYLLAAGLLSAGGFLGGHLVYREGTGINPALFAPERHMPGEEPTPPEPAHQHTKQEGPEHAH